MIYIKRAFISNLGDSMNVFLAKYLVKKNQFSCIHQHQQSPTGVEYIVIGSILQWASSKTIVWGAGFISESSKVKQSPKHICAVRGPLTHKLLSDQGIDCPTVYGDPALLYPKFFKPNMKKEFELGIVPHYIDRKVDLVNKFRNIKGITVIDVQKNVDSVVSQICMCKKIASSCLHGIICADSYGVPSTWVKFSDKVIGQGFKFRDYFASVGRKDTEPLIMKESTTIQQILDQFYDYKINTDLDKLYDACPFRERG